MTATRQAPARKPVPFGTIGPRPKQPSAMLSARVCQELIAMAERHREAARKPQRPPACVRWLLPDREAGA